VPANLEALKAALAEIDHPNVQIYPYALSHKNAQVRFSAPPSAHKSGIGHILNEGEAGDENVFTVEGFTLDSLSLDPATLVFIDVEGAEVNVLQGAHAYIQAHRSVIMVEVIPRQLSRSGTSVEALHNLIVSLGYEAFSLERASLGKPTYDVVATDWICIPNEQREKSAEISRMLRLCAYLPCAFGLNPISHRH
jgi:FkbM family methyltransferase